MWRERSKPPDFQEGACCCIFVGEPGMEVAIWDQLWRDAAPPTMGAPAPCVCQTLYIVITTHGAAADSSWRVKKVCLGEVNLGGWCHPAPPGLVRR